jgi:UDPglucose 6-dehydrogenase
MKIAVVGTDTVGLVSATCFAEIGVQVTCINSDAKLIENLNNGIIHVYEPGLEERLNRNHRDGNLKFATDIKPLIDQIDLVVCATPTPAMPDGTIDLRQVAGLARTMGQTVTKYFAIAILSTVPIGTARQLRAALNIELEKRGANIHYDIISLPEFLREGSAVRDFLKPDRIVAGVGSEKGEELVRQLYKPLLDRGTPLILTDQTSAELIKYASNAMLANRISFMNVIANLSELVGADIDMVMKGMGADPRIGADYLNSGCGYGGTSLPKDVKALIKTAEKAGYAMKVVKAVDEVNDSQQKVVYRKLLKCYNGNIKGKNVAVWGLAFKPDTADVRQSTSLVTIEQLLAAGCEVSVYDPVAIDQAKKILGDKVTYANDMYDAVLDADALLLVTEWKQFANPSWGVVARSMRTKVVIDGRNLYSLADMKKYGFDYHRIGKNN